MQPNESSNNSRGHPSRPHAVLVTGASSGIGKEFAHIAASEGLNVIITARSTDALQRLKRELQAIKSSSKVAIVTLDLSEPGNAEKLYNGVSKKYTITHLINNAGFGDYAPVAGADLNKLQNMIDLNVRSLTTLAKLAAQDMKQRGGGFILNVASIAGFVPGPNMAVYYATKNYVLSFSEALHQELVSHNVRVTALCPGPTRTQFEVGAGIENKSIFASKNLPGPREVAEHGWASLNKNKAVAIHGWRNKFVIQMLRFAPRSLVAKLVARVQKKG